MAITTPTRDGDQWPRHRNVDWERLAEAGAALAAGLAAAWLPFRLLDLNAPFGFVVLWFLAFAVIFGIVVRQRHGALELKDRMASVLIVTGTAIALLPLFLIVFSVLIQGFHTVAQDFPHFLTHDLRAFGPNDPVTQAGMKAAIIGTLEQVGLATAVSVPIGILAATYLNEIGGRLAAVVRTVADAMTGLPTIVAGLFVYSLWVIPRHTNGRSGFAAAMALVVIMLPTMVRTAEEVLRIVSGSLREAALALGAPEWRVILRVVIPTARTGLVTAALLAVARGLGETAPIVLTAGGNIRTNLNALQGQQDSLTLRIYLLVTAPSTADRHVAYGGAFVLLILILTLFTLARIVGTGDAGRRRRAAGQFAVRVRALK